MEDTEIWSKIKDPEFEEFYEASSFGNIRSVKRKKILKPALRTGYLSITLCNPLFKRTENIHRIIALTFIDNPKELPVVNHKNGDKTCNRVENLEWCSYKENSQHALDTFLTKPSCKKVEQYSIDGDLIERFNSIREAEKKTGVGNRSISAACRGQRSTSHGFCWKYVVKHSVVEKTDVQGKPIEDFPNYIVTKDGKIYSISSKRYLILNPNGNYYYVKLCNNTIKKDFYVHVIVATAFIPKQGTNKIVNHKNLDKHDNRVENLEWITHSENTKHYNETRQKINVNENSASL